LYSPIAAGWATFRPYLSDVVIASCRRTSPASSALSGLKGLPQDLEVLDLKVIAGDDLPPKLSYCASTGALEGWEWASPPWSNFLTKWMRMWGEAAVERSRNNNPRLFSIPPALIGRSCATFLKSALSEVRDIDPKVETRVFRTREHEVLILGTDFELKKREDGRVHISWNGLPPVFWPADSEGWEDDELAVREI
jgi:hypothetical protein